MIAHSMATHRSITDRQYRWARSLWVTVAAILLERAYLVLLLLAADALDGISMLRESLGREPERLLVPADLEAWKFVAAALGVELGLNLLERVASYRGERYGRWLSSSTMNALSFLPLMRLVRYVLMLPFWLITVLPKLMGYFALLSTRLILPFLERWSRVQRVVDGVALGVCAGLVHGAIAAGVFQLDPGVGWIVLITAAVWPVALGIWGATVPSAIDAFDSFFEPLERLAVQVHNNLYFTQIHPGGGAFSTLFNAPLDLWCMNH